RVVAARERQRERFAAHPDASCNGRAPARWLLRDGGADRVVMSELARLSTTSSLSARGFDRVLRVARTIADLAQRACVTIDDVREAMRYRGEWRTA
ncbi:MAG TPA: hypothetical protein VJR92_10195, partial [Gemmatimonadaceae bacterium]|nr:hypothetical protein [Gemmatimonadaceae bacterium]